MMIMIMTNNNDNDDKRLIVMIIQKVINGTIVSKVRGMLRICISRTHLQPVIHGQRCCCARPVKYTSQFI